MLILSSLLLSLPGLALPLQESEPSAGDVPEKRDPVRAVAVSSDGRRVAAGHRSGRVELLDAEDGSRLRALEPALLGSTLALAFSPDDSTLAGVGREGELCLWPLGDVAEEGRVALRRFEAIRPDEVDIVPRIRLTWSPGSDRLARAISSGHLGYHFGVPVPVGWSPDGSRLWFRKSVSGGGGGSFGVGLHCVDFASPGGRSICVGDAELPVFGGETGAIIEGGEVQLIEGEGRRLWGAGDAEPAREPLSVGERIEQMESDESERPQRMDFFGASVVGLGDLDGDGVPECLVGAPEDRKNGYAAGSAWVFSGIDGEPLYRLEESAREERFGDSVCRLGDVNGDGVTDFAVGTGGRGSIETGYARIFSGKDGTLHVHLTGNPDAPRLGRSVRPAGDVNGDGVPDLSVGFGTGGPLSGLQVHSGNNGRLLHRLINKARGTETYGPGAGFGVGDVDGDGFDDLLVLAPEEATRCGYVYSAAKAAPIVSLRGTIPEGTWGPTSDLVGDIDGDGHRDVVIACMVHFDERLSWTRVYSTSTGEILLDLSGRSRYAFGPAVACAGDVDADGIPDVVLGDLSFLTAGAVAVFSGKDGTVLFDIQGKWGMQFLGAAVGAAGDVDRDGHDDFLVGIVNEWGPFQAGRVRIYSGRDASVIRQLGLDAWREEAK